MTDKSYLLRFGYAPGEYGHGKCADCDQKFFGDKYARRCEACAETLYSQVSSVEAVADKHRAMTTVSEEAVKAAQKAFYSALYVRMAGSDEAFREAISAALPFLPVQGAVKKLEWNEYNDEQGIPDRWDAEASSFGVFCSIEIQHDGYRVVFDHEAVGAIGVFDTLDAAKAAAQADYEDRILSALEPSAARETDWQALIDRPIVGIENRTPQEVHDILRDRIKHALSAPSAARELALEEAARNAAMYLATGFITCHRCGEEVETKDTDAEYTLRAALSSPDHADAGKVDGDGDRWRVFEAAVGGYWGIELEQASNDDDPILYPIKVHRDTLARIVDAHNADLPSAPSEGAE